MRILVCNDDGIYSPGLAALARMAARFGTVRVVAPDVEQSSMGHAITASRPLTYRSTPLHGFEAYRVNGTPADCVALGAYKWDAVDVVLSGINLGANLGSAIWHSGTLAGAKQASLLGIRGIALSAVLSEGDPDFAGMERHLEEVLQVLLHDCALPLVNVNFPEHPRGVRWTRQSVRHYNGKVVPGHDPMGRKHYWFVVKPIEAAEEGTDRWAVEHDFVSITPLQLNLTDEEELKRMAASKLQLMGPADGPGPS